MKRTALKTNPAKTREWQERSREKARENPKPRKPLATIGRVGKARRSKHDEWKRLVLERDGNRCRFPHRKVPGIPCGGPLDPHHVIPRSVRSDLRFVPANGIALCRHGHDWVEGHTDLALEMGLKGHEWETVEHGVVLRG